MTHLDRSFIIWSAFTLALGCQDPPKTYNDGSQGPLLPPVAGESLSGGVMMSGGGSAGETQAGETQAGEMLAGDTLAGEGSAGAEGSGVMAGVEVGDMEPPRDAASFDPIPFAVETRVGDRNTEAGLENRVTCQLLDQAP